MRGKKLPARGTADVRALLICALFFICGGVFGVMAAMSAEPGETWSKELLDSLSGLYSGPPGERIGSSLSCALRYCVLLLLSGFSVLGTAFVPLLSAVRGFTLSFSALVTATAFGDRGAFTALALYGPEAMVTVPCFFVLAVRALSASARLFRMSTGGGDPGPLPVYNRDYFAGFLVCAAVLALYALADACFLGMVVRMASHWAV